MDGWLRPGETFYAVWQVSDPSDTTAYFPQLIVRNSNTGTTLNTVNLTSTDNKRYTGNFVVPQDSSGLGTFIDAALTVYTDSARTTVSTNYQVEGRQYLVQARNVAQSYGGGGNYGLTADEVRKLIAEELSKVIKEPKTLEAREVEMIVRGLLKKELSSLPVPEKPAELSRIAIVEALLGQLGQSMSQTSEKHLKNFTEVQQKLLSQDEKITGLQILPDHITQNYASIYEVVKSFTEEMKNHVDAHMKKVEKHVEGLLRNTFSNVERVEMRPSELSLPKEKDYHVLAESLLG